MTDWAIIYARVSTEEQAEKGYSLEAQVEDCLRKAEELGYARETVRILTDEVSGAGMDRPGLNRLRELTASVHKPACVIMYDPDRFARKLSHQLILTDEILKNKVGLEFVNFTWNNTAEGRMFYQLRGMFAEFEREKIKERTIRGRMAKIQNHGKLSCNPRLFGYAFDKEEDVLQPDPLTAPVVKEMFELAAEGRSAAAIARLLEAEGTPGPRGEAWHASTVSRILRNTSYLGTYMAYKVDYHQGFRRKRPVEEQFPLPLEALITEELFDRARQALEKHRKHSGRPPEREYLLAGLGRCSCGRPMAADPGSRGRTSYYRCSGKKRSRSAAGRGEGAGPPCDSPYWSTGVVDGVVWDALDAHVTAWLKALAAGRAPKSLDKACQAAEQQPDSCPLLRKGKQLEGRRERLLELYLSGGLDRPAYERKRLELERERETLESRLREKSRWPVPAYTGWEETANRWESLRGSLSFSEKRRIAERLLLQVGFHKGWRLELGYRTAELPGNLDDSQSHGGL